MIKRLLLIISILFFYGCSEGNGGPCGGCTDSETCFEGTCHSAIYKGVFHGSSSVDVVFVVDNSGSMAGEQQQLGESFRAFTDVLDEKFGGDYHIGVITTGMESEACPKCRDIGIPNPRSCINDSGENGRLQEDKGYIAQAGDPPTFEFISDPTCRVVTSDNKLCFYDPSQNSGQGIALVGVSGCGYERGLAPLKFALDTLTGNYNANFIRKDATLAVVIISDEDDCGEVGDIWESSSDMGRVCYYASKGVGPDGETKYPGDPDPNRVYQLEPVETYHDFLVDHVKGGRQGMVKFAAVVGINDADHNGEITGDDLTATTIEYQPDRNVVHACTTAGCSGDYCFAEPGTRYIKLAQLFGIGQNGFVDTICQPTFSDTMEALGNFVACPRQFKLSEQPLDPDLASILINGEQVPLYSCSIPDRLETCSGPGDACSQGSCVLTWIYCANPGSAPECASLDFSNAAGGVITFADHYDPCDLITEGEVNIEFVYVPRN